MARRKQTPTDPTTATTTAGHEPTIRGLIRRLIGNARPGDSPITDQLHRMLERGEAADVRGRLMGGDHDD